MKKADPTLNINSPGSLGARIRRIREIKGWSQKELGVKAGFSESSAVVRIAQYESNMKVPRRDVIERIADALDINIACLYDADFTDMDSLYHILFDLEDLHGLHPVLIDNNYYLAFDCASTANNLDLYQFFLKKWIETKKTYTPSANDTDVNNEHCRDNYTLWKSRFPSANDATSIEAFSSELEIVSLQDKIDILYADMHREAERTRIHETIGLTLFEMSEEYVAIKKISDLIYTIKDMMIFSVDIAGLSRPVNHPLHYKLMLSIKTDSIVSDNPRFIETYCKFILQIGTLIETGIDIRTDIVSIDKQLYIAFYIREDQYKYFRNLHDYWKDINMLAKLTKMSTDADEIERVENILRLNITGMNDVYLPELDETVKGNEPSINYQLA